MKHREDILLELQELNSPLSTLISNKNIYSVPEGYFEELPLRILGKVSNNDVDGTVPADYFENLSTNILSRIKQEVLTEESSVHSEMEELAPAIAAIGNRNPYTVSEDYFSHSAEQILSNTSQKQAPVVQMRRMPKAVRYLVAAAFTGLVGFSLFTMFTNNQPKIEGMNAEVMAEAKTIVANDSFDETLVSLSAAEIETYLEDSGHDPDAAVVASAINDTELPDPVDYLLDENTLNEFLKDTKLTNN